MNRAERALRDLRASIGELVDTMRERELLSDDEADGYHHSIRRAALRSMEEERLHPRGAGRRPRAIRRGPIAFALGAERGRTRR